MQWTVWRDGITLVSSMVIDSADREAVKNVVKTRGGVADNELDTYVKTGDSTKVTNVFNREGKLSAVGTFNDFDRQDIKIEIMSADFGDVMYTQEASLDYQGYHTVQLSTHMSDEDIKTVLTTGKGRSVYFSENGMWKDFLNETEAEPLFTADFAPGNCCIKALFQG